VTAALRERRTAGGQRQDGRSGDADKAIHCAPAFPRQTHERGQRNITLTA